ncbi:MAG: hypothetical protein GX421_12510 [Caldisericales bacterium]|nr:hypothetical protein [Caldisericales bacterium]
MPYLRESILTNLVTTMRGITKANGYETNVRQVSRKYKEHDQVTNFAHVCVVAAGSRLRHLNTNQEFESDLGFTLIGYVRPTARDIADGDTLGKAIESLIGDTIKAIYTDFHRGDLTGAVDETVLETVEPYYDWEKNIGVMVITGHVLYHTTFSNP